MRTLAELGAYDGEGWRAVLAQPLGQFVEESLLSVRASTALQRAAEELGAATIGEICTPRADELVHNSGGGRVWREVVDMLAGWAEDRADRREDLPEDAQQVGLFERVRPHTPPPPLPKQGDPRAAAEWAARLEVSDLLSEPLRRLLPPSLTVYAPTIEDRSLLDGLVDARDRPSPGPGRRAARLPAVIAGVLRNVVAQFLIAASDTRQALAAREQAHPRVAGAAEVGPLAELRAALVTARAGLGAPEARPPGTYVQTIAFRNDPAQLEYGESPVAHVGAFVAGPSVSVRISLVGWSGGPLTSVCTCRPAVDACPHRAVACDAALDLLERPSLPAHRALLRYLETPAWQRLLNRIESGLAHVAARPAAPEERLAWIVRQRSGGNVILAAVIQRRGARGWTKGAITSTSELTRRLESIGAPTDARVLDIINGGVNPWASGQLTEPARVFRALEALTGATNVYLEERRDAPAAVRRVSLRVVVEQSPAGAGYRFRFALGDAAPLDASTLLALAGDRRHAISIDDAANAVWVARVPPEVAPLIEAVHREPATLPEEAFGPLLSRLDRVQAAVPFDLPESVVGDTVAADRRVICRLTPLGDDGLALELGVRPLSEGPPVPPGSGAVVVFGARAGARIAARRDLEAERREARAVIAALPLPETAGTGDWCFVVPEQEQALDLVVALRELSQGDEGTSGLIVEWPQEAWKVASAGASGLRLRVTQRRDWFGLDGGLEIDGQMVTLAALIEAFRRRRRYLALGPGRFARIEDVLRARLAAADDALILHRGLVELGAAAPDAVTALVDDPGRLETIPSFHDLCARRTRAAQHTPKLPPGLRAKLRPYQQRGFEWLSRLAEGGVGACLADDMGLGKTVQTLAVLLERASRGPALVIAPTSVVAGWVAEAERFAPDLRRILYRGADREQLLAKLGPGDLVVTSYAIVTRDAEALAAIPFAALVIDEAQALKNAQARRTHAVRALQADWRLALSGTPIENHLGELWSVFRVVSPALFGGWEHFRERFAVPIERYRDQERRRALATLIGQFLLRRTKQVVAPELPPKTELTRFVDLAPAERRLYDAARANAVSALTRAAGPAQGKRRFQILAALTRLRLLACHPRLFDEESTAPSSKIAVLLELCATLRETGRRALVFSQFVSFLELARQALETSGAQVLLLHGGTPAGQRATLIDNFQNGAGDVFLISLKAGGTGLNLTEADTVIHLDPWWNPAVEDQASDRSHRIGQKRPVTVVRLVARGTVEEAVLALHADKRALAAAVLDGADGGGPLDAAELLGLLQAGAPDRDSDAGEDRAVVDSDEDDEPPPSEPAPLLLESLDLLTDRAIASLNASSSRTATQYRRALGRFREFVSAGHALGATSWSEAGELFLTALRDGTWPAPPSLFLVARTCLGHLRRAEGRPA